MQAENRVAAAFGMALLLAACTGESPKGPTRLDAGSCMYGKSDRSEPGLHRPFPGTEEQLRAEKHGDGPAGSRERLRLIKADVSDRRAQIECTHDLPT